MNPSLSSPDIIMRDWPPCIETSQDELPSVELFELENDEVRIVIQKLATEKFCLILLDELFPNQPNGNASLFGEVAWYDGPLPIFDEVDYVDEQGQFWNEVRNSFLKERFNGFAKFTLKRFDVYEEFIGNLFGPMDQRKSLTSATVYDELKENYDSQFGEGGWIKWQSGLSRNILQQNIPYSIKDPFRPPRI